MARVHQYTRSLDAMTTNFDISQISTFNREEIMIKQEPCDTNNIKVNDNCVSTNIQCEYINLTKNNSGQEENVLSTTKNLSNNVITRRIRMESISMSNAIIENSKHVQQKKRLFVVDENDKNDGTLEENDNINRSNNRLRKSNRQIYKCDICFLSFSNLQCFNFHKNYYMKNNIYFCKSCSSNSCYHIKEKNNKKMFHNQFYKCHFCEQWFGHKKSLQAHLLHNHIEGMNGMNVVENNKLANKVKQQKMGNETEKEATFDENTHNSEVNMSELLTTFKQEEEWRDNKVDELSMDQIVSNVSGNKLKENRPHNQPFVKIHIDRNMMEALLRIPDNKFLNKSLPYNSNNNSNNNITSKPYALRSLNNSKELNNTIMSAKVVQKNDQRDDKLSKHLNACKTCIIPLIKCDNIINVEKPIRLTSNSSQFNTLSSQISRSSPDRKSINNKLTSNKRKNTTPSAFNNRTSQINHSKDLINIDSPIEEPPMKIIRSRSIYSPLDLHISDNIVHYRNKRRTRYNRNKLGIKRRPIINRRIFDQKLKRSPRKDNIKNFEVSPTVQKLNTEVLENNKLAINNVKLKEVKISLKKLPEIKKKIIINIGNEIIPEETFLCQICNSSLTSKKSLRKHIKKCHTAYISSICRARYSSKRLLLKHYLKEHDTWTSKCCVCHKFINKRLLLKQHLLLHCIKITLSKIDSPLLNTNFKCRNYKCKPTAIKIILKMSKLSKKPLEINYDDNNCDVKATEHQEIDNNDKNNKEKQTEHQEIDNGENNQEKTTETEEMNNDENNKKKSTESEDIYIDNDNNKKKSIEFQEIDNDNDNVHLTEPLTSDNTEVSFSDKAIEEPILDHLQVVGSTFTICNPNENPQRELTLNTSNSIQPSINDGNESLSITEITAEKKEYQCIICKQRFQKIESLQRHKRIYDPSFDNYCIICEVFFSTKQTLKNHINATHNLDTCNSYKLHCQFCNQGFRSQNNLRIHELHYHGISVTVNNKKITDFLQISNGENNRPIELVCKACGLIFNTVESYQLHCMYFYKDHIFPCKFCDKVFHGLYMLHRHNKLFHHSEDISTFYKYKCIICHEGFASETQLQAQKLLHVHLNEQVNISPLNSVNSNQTNKSYICSKCNMEFFTVVELLTHIEYFSNHGNYKCSKCSRKCYTLSILNNHMNLTHLDNGLTKRYTCGICGEVLISRITLLSHQKHVHGDLENEQIVSTISHEYSETDLRNNEITDEDISIIDNESAVLVGPPNSSLIAVKKYNFYCSICPLKFEKEIYLKEHLAEYLDYGDYQCNKCQRRFVNFDFLKKHDENHFALGMPTTEYYCNLCNEVCKSSIVLESHVAHLHARIIFKNFPSKDV